MCSFVTCLFLIELRHSPLRVLTGYLFLSSYSAGEGASFGDAAYANVGAIVVPNSDLIFDDADIVTKIRPPDATEIPKLAGKTLISTIQPSINGDLYQSLTKQNTNVFALDCVPRMLSRGQSYDILSSQANIAGYRAGTLFWLLERIVRFF
jgi:H+-translocating NAD(P) transhydrogenase